LAQRKEVRRAQLEAQYAARAKLGVPVGQPMYPGPHQGMFYQSPVGGVRPPFAGYPQPFAGGPPRRWTGAPGQGQAPGQVPLIGMPRGPVQYQLMPVANGGRGGPAPGAVNVAGGAGGAGGGGGRRRNGQQAGGPKGQMAGQPQYKYTENARNRDQRPVQPPSPSQSSSVPEPSLPLQASEPLTIKALAAAPEEQKKQMIGERLFPLIQQHQPALAGKITGMLLEMDNGELIHLLESREALNEKIDEALTVLRQHPQELEAAADVK